MGTSNKGSWYKLLIDEMDESIKNKYYFESIFIEYMIIDDRIKSLILLLEIDLNKSDGNPKMIGQLIDELKSAKNRQDVGQWDLLNNGIPLASKEFLISMKNAEYPTEIVYECTHVPRRIINYKMSPKKRNYISKYGANDDSLLTQIKAWVDMRNHWMHAAGNDALTLEEYESEITPLAIDGNSFVRELCDVTNKIKRNVEKSDR